MDYQGQGTRLHKYQWDLVHNPEAMLGWFQDDEQNAMEGMGEEEFDVFFSSVETLMIDPESELRQTLEKIKIIYEFIEQCNNENWTSYQGQGVVPHCLWRDANGKGIPFTAGVVDGAYLEYEGIKQLVPLVSQFHDNISQLIYAYTVGYWKCRVNKIEANSIKDYYG